MSFLGQDPNAPEDEEKMAEAMEPAKGARLIPRITIQAFCEHSQTAQLVETAIHDRRMAKVALTTHNGGLEAAIETYRANPTPNLIILETTLPPGDMIDALTRLASVCDAETRLIVLGHVNDVVLYRDLIRFGVSEYLVLPTDAQTIVAAITDLFVAEDASPIGRTVGFVGSKGGSGASTTAHNVAWSISQNLRQDVLIIDMDLAFGTVGLNFNQDPPHGIIDALFANEKMDAVMLDRLMSKAANHLNLLAANGSLEKTFDLGEGDFEQIIELSQKTVPVVVLDIPHAWNGWVRHSLAALDEIVIVAEPDLANLRNTKNLADSLKTLRPVEREPLLVMNRVGMPRRPEIPAAEFAQSVECRLIGQVGFDAALFGTAANNGQMIAEVSGSAKINEIYRNIGRMVTGRSTPMAAQKGGKFQMPELFRKLKRA